MSRIHRHPEKASEPVYDLIVVGGGIYGVSMTLEAARRGLKVLLLERDDFGAATSWNSLRILHGGLRYLQKLDLNRFSESVGERRWFCRHFPDLVRPLACLMPLYGRGMRRPSIFKLALRINDRLSRKRNEGVRADRHFPDSRLLSRAETISLFEAVDQRGLRGGALWYDALMTNSQRVLVEMLRWACTCGATVLNYVSAEQLILDGSRVGGARGVDRFTQQSYSFRAPVLINCAGPWCGQLAARFDRRHPRLFRPSLAFNLLLDRESISTAALALTPKGKDPRFRVPGGTYFLHPWRNRILAGTYHATWGDQVDQPCPDEGLIDQFLGDLNLAAPQLEFTRADVVRVYAGLLPARAPRTAELAVREVIEDHGGGGGPAGLWSVSGVKFTTARLVAQKALEAAFKDRDRIEIRAGTERPGGSNAIGLDDPAAFLNSDDDVFSQGIKHLIDEEAVLTMDDLLLRRTDWAHDPAAWGSLAAKVTELTGWRPWCLPKERQQGELSSPVVG